MTHLKRELPKVKQNTQAFEKSATINKEVKEAREHFENLEQQLCALETHIRAIEHGKGGFLMNHKPLLSLGIGLNLDEQLDDEYVVHSMKVTVCAFCGGKFPPAWECHLATCMHMYHSWCVVAHFSISMKCLVKVCH